MKNSILGILLLPIIFLVPEIYSQGSSTISGFVFDQQRRPIPRIRIEILNEVNSVLHRVTTDGSGRFMFTRLSSGRFIVKVLPFGTNFKAQEKDVEISGVGVSGRQLADNVQLDFYLQPERKNNPDTINDVVFAQDVPDEAKNLYKKAVSDLEDNRYEAGIDSLKKSILVFPSYFVALEKLGQAYLNEKNFAESSEYFRKALQVNDRSFISWYGLGYSSYALKEWRAAVEAVEQAASLNPGSMQTSFLLGISLRQVKEFQKAEKALIKAKELTNEKNPDIHWNLALLYYHDLKKYSAAADELELYLKALPKEQNEDLRSKILQVRKLIKTFRSKARDNS